MNAIRQTRSAACPSFVVSTDRRTMLRSCLPTEPRVALACRWRLEADGCLTCIWERAAAPPRLRRRHPALVPKEVRPC